MNCNNCGAENTDRARFCVKCGGALEPTDLCEKHNTVNAKDRYFFSILETDFGTYLNAVGRFFEFISILGGLCGIGFGLYVLLSDLLWYSHNGSGYSYQGLLSTHEIQIVLLLILSVLSVVFGICLPVYQRQRR